MLFVLVYLDIISFNSYNSRIDSYKSPRLCSNLKIYPREFSNDEYYKMITIDKDINLGVFSNNYGYNDWRFPTKSELSLLKQFGYLRQKKYKTNRYEEYGLTILVTSGLSIAEKERIAEQKRKEEQERITSEQRRKEQIRIAEEKRKLEEQKAREKRLAEEKRKKEQEQKAKEKRLAEEKRKKEQEQKAKEKAAEEKRENEQEQKAKYWAEYGSGYHKGYSYVDLGLSVKWATRNIGAYSYTSYGWYYAWGETSVKSYYFESNYKKPSSNKLSKSKDVAHKKWGGKWRLPTKEESEELYRYCDVKGITIGGTKGFMFTSRLNGRSVFFPAGGYYDGGIKRGNGLMYYWTSESVSSSSASTHNSYRSKKSYGLLVRAVCP